MAKMFYANAIPFNVADSETFKEFVKAVRVMGPSYVPASSHPLRTTLLDETVQSITTELDVFNVNLQQTGCTVVSDGWDDALHRPILNILKVTPDGAEFVVGIDTSLKVKSAEYIAGCLMDAIQST